MGRSGAALLWSSGITGHCQGTGTCARQGIHSSRISRSPPGATNSGCITRHNNLDLHDQSYRVKPHEQLVLVSLSAYTPSTPSLSTSWSRTTLQGAQGPGRSHLETSFPLRCFQRLSLPHLATLRCHGRDNRYTRGASTPVLSY